MTRPPTRMLEDPTLPSHVVRDVRQALAEPEPYDVRSGEVRLAAALGLALPDAARESLAPHAAETGAAAASGTSATLLGSAAVKIGAVATATAAAVALTVVAWPERATPDESSSAPASARAHDEAAAAPAPAPQPDVATAVPPRARRTSTDADAELRREIAQLGRIKALLEADQPAQAYGMAQAGHRAFPSGMLREEREALAVLALWDLGRLSEAAARSRAFLARYPHSAHREEIERHLRSEHGDARGP